MPAEKIGNKSLELPPRVLFNEGKRLTDEIFQKLISFDAYKVAAGKAYPNGERGLVFTIGNSTFQLDAISRGATKILSLGINGKLKDGKTEAVKHIRISFNEALPDSTINNQIVFKAYEDSMPISDEPNTQGAINKIQGIINGLEKRKPSSRSVD